MNKRRIALHNVEGFGKDGLTLPDGVDEDGKIWVYRRKISGYICLLCGAPVTEGWLCFDTGNVVCATHVTVSGKIQ
jgi:hypothetical protein